MNRDSAGSRRISLDDYFISVAYLASRRSTCRRRNVGCVLVSFRNHVLATGVNGNPAGFTHCLDVPCRGADSPSGKNLDLCEAIHAEQNALLQCKDVFEIKAAYCTTSPCITCVKLLLNTSCETIYYVEEYPHHNSRDLWLQRTGNSWTQLSLPSFFISSQGQ